MTTIKVELPQTLSVALKHHDVPVSFDLSKVPEDKLAQVVEYGLVFGLRQSAGDSDAGMKDDTTAERKAAVRKKFNAFQAGIVPSGGGGGGATQSPEIRAEIVWVKMGLSGKAIAKVNGKTVAEHLLGKLRVEVYNLTDEGEERTTMLKSLPDLFPDWRIQNRKDDAVLAGLIEAEKALDAAKAKTASVGGEALRNLLLAKAEKAEETETEA